MGDRAGAGGDPAPRLSKRMLVAYDGSPAARQALERACALASPEVTVTVISVRHSPGLSTPIDSGGEPRDAQHRVLDEARQFLTQRGIDAAVLAPIGAPAKEILAAARRTRADLIVVGRGRGRLPHIGSISSELVRLAECDVLVVHAGATRDDGPDEG